MAPRVVWGALVDGYQPATLLDQSFQDVGSLGVIPCSASGTNALTITPIPGLFPPNINNPPNANQVFSFVAKATSTGLVTSKIDSATGFFNVYRIDGVTQAGSGDIVSGVAYLFLFNPALNSNAGGLQIISPATDLIGSIITGATITGSTIATTTISGNTWTAGTGTLTIAAGKTLTANNSITLAGVDGKTLTTNNNLTLAGTDGTTLTFQGSDTYVGRTTTDTLTNKTINGNNNTLTVLGASQISGNIPVTNLNSGTNANATTFWRGDGTWQAPPAGSYQFLETLSPSNVATIATAASWTGFSAIEIVFENMVPVTTGQALTMQVVTGGGVQTTTYAGQLVFSNAGTAGGATMATTAFQLTSTITNTANQGGSGTLRIYNPLSATQQKTMTFNFMTNTTVAGSGGGVWQTTTALTGAQFSFPSGNISAGTIKVYGIV